MADARRDILLKTALERDVHLVRFEEGRIELRVAPGGRASLANDLAAAIEAWTGRRWVVALSKDEGAQTHDARAKAAGRSAEPGPGRVILGRRRGQR